MSHYERFAKNAMIHDLGFDNGEQNEETIQGWINYIDQVFDLVLITDYFEESMILLKVRFLYDAEIFFYYVLPPFF